MNFEKSVIFTIFHRFERKHNVAHLLLVLYLCAQSENYPMRTFGDIARTRRRIFTKFTQVLKILSFSQFFIESNENTTLHTFDWCSIRVCNLKTFHRVLSEIQPGHETGQTDGRTDGKAETYIPSFHGG